MAKKNPKGVVQPNEDGSTRTPIGETHKPKASPVQESRTSELPLDSNGLPPLVICRNKHLRYISSYHGPWHSMPIEVLERLAFSNFHNPRPRPIDPAVFFDLVKIKRLIEDATTLAVRAADGTTSSSLRSSVNATNGILNGADAELLGIGLSRDGGNAKLSRERKHRMREQATQKLAHAYNLDEVASSVGMMQGTSALEDVAKLVLQKNPQDPDAQYVHFFHEKMPGQHLAQYTTLDPLDDVVRQKPTEASSFRTRAIARMLLDDVEGAARDCTEGLAVYRLYHSQHPHEEKAVVLARDAAKQARDPRPKRRVEEKDQPSSLEPQLLFHRASAYLTLACNNIGPALVSSTTPANTQMNGDAENAPEEDKKQARARSEARKLVRTYAKRALRDYTSFLAHLEYTPGLSAEYTEPFLAKISSASLGHGKNSRSERAFDINGTPDSGLAEAIIKYEGQQDSQKKRPLPQVPKLTTYALNTLFAAVSPAELRPYPPEPGTRPKPGEFSLPDFTETVTYHPLLPDALHLLLMCHCLIQTSTKELLRHAYMAARIVGVCDSYPVFLASRSTAKADWIEILRRSRNWLGLSADWDELCSRAPVPGKTLDSKPRQPKGVAKLEPQPGNGTTFDGLPADEVQRLREETLKVRLEAPEKSFSQEEEDAAMKELCKAKFAENGLTFFDKTRAPSIARWIEEAPPPSAADGGSRPKKKTGAKGRLGKTTSTPLSLRGKGLEPKSG
ncbi:hypothetical protein LTR72_006164 [Exophiala xenobiotica]|nr:hypothetical protein LTR72_006164 [Exophiala xenobiotica]KAK5294944.1 hypothetical protein LTR14_004113 [Exophiala xenobiotica]KAK5483016.1 hypothetical protein LTR55_006415 [Exophiala xenobiotica]